MRNLEVLKELIFDESDRNLFQVDDVQLRADAIKYSILPRMHQLINYIISLINKVYDLNPLEDSHISAYPNFRTSRRKNALSHLYENAFVSLHGKVTKNKWLELKRKDGGTVQFMPIRFAISIDENGGSIYLENWRMKLSKKSYAKFYEFNIEYENMLHRLCHDSHLRPFVACGRDCKPFSTYREHYEFMIENSIYDIPYFVSYVFPFPLTFGGHIYSLDKLIDSYLQFFPVYDSYLQICMGKPVRFEKLIDKLNEWEYDNLSFEESELSKNSIPVKNAALPKEEAAKIMEAAAERIRVMPAIRWQVFQRDNWKCVACGKSAANDVILHVDHIIPRSKGGQDEMDNYQTLCSVCNIGKSNKDETDLRQLHGKSKA